MPWKKEQLELFLLEHTTWEVPECTGLSHSGELVALDGSVVRMANSPTTFGIQDGTVFMCKNPTGKLNEFSLHLPPSVSGDSLVDWAWGMKLTDVLMRIAAKQKTNLVIVTDYSALDEAVAEAQPEFDSITTEALSMYTSQLKSAGLLNWHYDYRRPELVWSPDGEQLLCCKRVRSDSIMDLGDASCEHLNLSTGPDNDIAIPETDSSSSSSESQDEHVVHQHKRHVRGHRHKSLRDSAPPELTKAMIQTLLVQQEQLQMIMKHVMGRLDRIEDTQRRLIMQLDDVEMEVQGESRTHARAYRRRASDFDDFPPIPIRPGYQASHSDARQRRTRNSHRSETSTGSNPLVTPFKGAPRPGAIPNVDPRFNFS